MDDNERPFKMTIRLALTREEWATLVDIALREARHPRQQAAYIVMQALRHAEKPPIDNSTNQG